MDAKERKKISQKKYREKNQQKEKERYQKWYNENKEWYLPHLAKARKEKRLAKKREKQNGL